MIIVIVGLPDAAVKESRDRVMTALINSGFNFTFGRTTISLAPADVKKEGLSSIASAKEEPSFDLPIAIGMVAASERTETEQLENSKDFAEVKGQESVKRAMEIAAAGGHTLLWLSPPASKQGSAGVLFQWQPQPARTGPRRPAHPARRHTPRPSRAQCQL